MGVLNFPFIKETIFNILNFPLIINFIALFSRISFKEPYPNRSLIQIAKGLSIILNEIGIVGVFLLFFWGTTIEPSASIKPAK